MSENNHGGARFGAGRPKDPHAKQAQTYRLRLETIAALDRLSRTTGHAKSRIVDALISYGARHDIIDRAVLSAGLNKKK